MEFVRVRRIVAALLLSFPFIAAGEGAARAGEEDKGAAIRASRGAWSVREVRVRDSKRIERAYSPSKAEATKSDPRMGFSTFSRGGSDRKMAVLRYATPLSLGPSDFLLEVRAPGGRGSLLRVKLEF